MSFFTVHHDCIPVQSPPVHSWSCVLSCSLGLSGVQTGILPPSPPPHHHHHRCHQHWGLWIAARFEATADNVQYSSPDGPEREQTLFIEDINRVKLASWSRRTQSQSATGRVPVAPGGRLGLREQWCMAPVSRGAGGLVQVHSIASAKDIKTWHPCIYKNMTGR